MARTNVRERTWHVLLWIGMLLPILFLLAGLILRATCDLTSYADVTWYTF